MRRPAASQRPWRWSKSRRSQCTARDITASLFSGSKPSTSRARARALHRERDPAEECSPAAAEVVATEEARAHVERVVSEALAALSPRDRELIVSRYLRIEEGRTTARRMGVSPSFVSRRCHQVLELLRRRLAPALRDGGGDVLEAES